MSMHPTTLFGLAALLAVSLGACATEAGAVKNLTACQTINAPGSYKLTRNLTAQGDCLVLTAAFITLALNGHTIIGNGTGANSTERTMLHHEGW
jgi:hypothetical protein